MNRELLSYKVGALMYVPALNTQIGEKVCGRSYKELDSLAFCLEDAITPSGVEAAEKQLVETLRYIAEHKSGGMPLLFVRVRGPAQFERMPALLGDLTALLTGVIFPKFDLSNAAEYCSLTGQINANRDTPLYIMPILESASVMNIGSRKRTLLGIRELLEGYKDYVLNIRVGAMDFCKPYGLRRTVEQSIYDIGVVRDALFDIINVFAEAFVVSAPVWEYFESDGGDNVWKQGLERELKLDITNGFIGKTAIHPSQLPVIRQYLKPPRHDVDDALEILNWKDKSLGVARSANGARMNELATHREWAKKILMLQEVYGVRDI